MSVAAALRITSREGFHVVKRAVNFAHEQRVPCFVISVVGELPYGTASEEERDVVDHNLEAIRSLDASPVMQEGDDVAGALFDAAQIFGVRTLFVDSGTRHLLSRTIPEQLIDMQPPFDIVVVGSATI